MEVRTPRPNYSNIIAACIVAAGLVCAARIVAGRPALSPGAAIVSTDSAGGRLPAPPFSQEAVKKQVRDQILAAPTAQTFHYDHIDYKLRDVTVPQVSYDAKNDDFFATIQFAWEPAMPSDGPQDTNVQLNNNGYNQYTGAFFLKSVYSNTSSSTAICVK